MTELYNITNNTETEKREEDEETNNYIPPQEKSHWEKYKVYYLVFGCLFLTILIILISNSDINKRIQKINERLDGNRYYKFKNSSSKKADYLSRLEKEPFPEYVKERVKEEIEKSKCGSFDTTKEIRKEWIDQVMSFPWHKTSLENVDIVNVEKVLNQNHFGMEEIKETIIEHLVAKKQAGKNFGKVLCLVGEPGTGKTSIARSIAQALEKPFEKISLGGIHDEAEIRGHRCTYISAKPGVIVQAFQRAKVKNPVINLDEIDKMGESKHNGNPTAAFLEILDPEQNDKFRDHYIELPIDLSQAMFICTANQIENIPGPLRDRMQVIKLPSYTEVDKLLIAKKFLIPSLLTFYNLNQEKLKFEDEAIQKIIYHYTWEAGIRNLERKLRIIVQKFIVKIRKGQLSSENITSWKISSYLGNPETPDLSVTANYSLPGVVNGLSVYSQELGRGDILPIEVIYIDNGKGKIIITGNLKETMKESAEVALSYVRKNCQNFGINFDFDANNIHIHVPKGGISKDGASAGTALTTAIISALTKKVISEKVGMTGEITLHGQVSGIGGLKEKLNSAYRKELKFVFAPEDNRKNLDDVPSEIKNKIEIFFVKNYQEIWDKMEELKLTKEWQS